MKKMLEGLKVIDFTNIIAGPLSTAMMADYGAEVIHVEKPKIGDDNREFPIKMSEHGSLGFWANNRGKKSVVLDIKDPEGKALFLKLCETADVVVESFRPGVMERAGLGYEDVKKINPRVIYCSVSAFGQKGPYKLQAGYDVIAQAFSGFMHQTGERDGTPMKTGYLIGDCIGAFNAYGSIMSALYYRERTGIGQHIDISLARSLLFCNLTFDRLTFGIDNQRSGNHDSGLMPYGVYEGNNGEHVVIAVLSHTLWQKFCRAANHMDWLENPDYATVDGRVKHQEELKPLITEWVKSYPHVEDVCKVLTEAGVPNIKVYTHTDIYNDPHARECEWVIHAKGEKDCPQWETYISRGLAADFSETPGDPYQRPPLLGENNFEVLEACGLSREKIAQLEEKWSK